MSKQGVSTYYKDGIENPALYDAAKSPFNVKEPPGSHEMNDIALDVNADDPIHSTAALTPAVEDDPWDATNLLDTGKKWSELNVREKIKRVIWEYICRLLFLVVLLYMFICSLDFLSSAFRLLGGRAAGRAFANNELLANPVAGLMVGVLATVLVQSSSTSTSIIITMVGAGLLHVRVAIPIIMGSNIGTSITNTIVALGHIGVMNDFRRAFGGATVHDMFNWLTVFVLLPLEVASGYLYHTTTAIINSMDLETFTSGHQDMLQTITKPFTKLVISIDTSKIAKIATGEWDEQGTLIKQWCKTKTISRLANTTINDTMEELGTTETMVTEHINVEKCKFMFMNVAGEWPDETIGAILLAIALLLLCVCLILIVRILHMLLRGRVAVVLKKFINADFPGRWQFLTGYLAILVGAAMTILVQSSSIFTSALTPLVGVGVLKIHRMYPLTLGSNIGTTTTGILAALATSGKTLPDSLQVAFCHLFFNISGIVIYYPIPFMRALPINLAKWLGNKTADYRWFALVYVFMMFFGLPAIVFGLSLAGLHVLAAVMGPIVLLFIIILLINLIQSKRPQWLPAKLRSWEWLPLFMHSLEPYDRVLKKLMMKCKCCKNRSVQNITDDHGLKSLPKNGGEH